MVCNSPVRTSTAVEVTQDMEQQKVDRRTAKEMKKAEIRKEEETRK
jgi:hypothetical protein